MQIYKTNKIKENIILFDICYIYYCHFSEASIFNISGDETGASISLARNGSLDREKLSSITLVIMVRIYFYILITDTSLSHSIIIVQGTKQNF